MMKSTDLGNEKVNTNLKKPGAENASEMWAHHEGLHLSSPPA
jgi:hypothetical protein